MMYTSIITQKGQITIPIRIRNKLGLTKGKKAVFVEENDFVFLKSGDEKADKAVTKYIAFQFPV